jgi:peptide/nickel transport system substrate-binding protein
VDGRQPPADEGVRRASAQRPSLAGHGRARNGPITFLFADIRGFTRFTASHGAQAAACLADSFVSLVTDVVSRHRGGLRGSWGDEVLVEFASPRDAVRAAVEIQQRCIDATLREPSVPLAVGIGVDVGEPADEGDHRSASALNVAARLCSRAGPGVVLASGELVHLAGAVDDLSYVAKGTARFKGVDGPTHVVLVRHREQDAEQARRFKAVLAAQEQSSRRPALALTAATVAVVLAAALTLIAVVRANDPATVALPPGGVAGVDPDSGRLVDAVRVGGDPEGMAVGGGDLWVAQAGSNSVARIDTESGRVVRTVEVGKVPVAVASSGRDVWVVNNRDATVARISTATNRVVQTIAVGNHPSAVATGLGSVWVANENDATVTRIDARSGKVTGEADVGRGPAGVAVGAGAVWVSNSRDGTVSAVDPQTLETGAPVRVGAGPKGITVAPSGVWVANRLELTVSRIGVRSRQVVDTIAVGDSPFAVASVAGDVWVTAGADGALVRIDARSGAVIEKRALGAAPYGLAVAGDRVWAATRPFAAAGHIGGTLRVAMQQQYADGLQSLDPVRYADPAIVTLLHDGLLGFRRASGAGNLDLAPSLSVGIPTPTDGGRIYSFRLRPGIRYSDGRPVLPADFRRGVERHLSVEGHAMPGGYDAIVGAEHCGEAARRCDLSDGIVVGDGVVTFRLTRPDPDFLFKMALPYVAPAPPGTPMTASPRGVLGTGPYSVAEFTPQRSLRLERNPHFRSWSAAARPPAYPDAITWTLRPDARLVPEVLAGRFDHTNLFFVPRTTATEVALQAPAQVHTELVTATFFLIPNTARPPFDDPTVRRALSLAVDRGRLTEMLRGDRETATCGLLPPGMPGYEPYCPPASRPGPSGQWQAPNLDLARVLLDRSGAVGSRVEVYWPKWSPPFAAAGRYTRRLLRDLGFEARLHWIRSDDFAARSDLSFVGWYADYPSPSSFYEPLLSCGSAENLGQHCDRGLDALAQRAGALSETDPGESHRLWQQVYRTVSEQVPVIPVFNGVHHFLAAERVGNYQDGAFVGPLYDQMWVR